MSNPFEGFEIKGAPNLDDFSIDPADFLEAAKVFDLYAAYCRTKRMAMHMRKQGVIDEALDDEAAMADLYSQLPDWAKW